MHSVQIKYLEPLTGLFSKPSERITISPGITLSRLLEHLFRTYAQEFKQHEIDPTSAPIVVMHNGKTVPSQEMDVALKNNDSIVLWMPVAGG